jgi:electron transport complex protein RnfD
MTTAAWHLPSAATARAAPHRLSDSSIDDILRAWIFAAGICAICGLTFFGFAALRVILVAVSTAMACDALWSTVGRKRSIGGLTHSALTGLLLALTLPAPAAWYVPAVGAAVAVILAKGLFVGEGRYLWQPALVGRVVVQFLFASSFAMSGPDARWPVLAPGHLLVGRLSNAAPVDVATYGGWGGSASPAEQDAWLMPVPAASIRAFSEGRLPADGNLDFEPLIRDHLPPWRDTVLGLVPGGIGETCTLAIIVAGLYLIYRGYLRWQLPVTMLAAAAVAAVIFPIESSRPAEGYLWFPGLAVEEGRAVGLAYVLYNLTSGQLMLGAFLLAGDMISTPLRVRGQVAFAIGAGVLTIFMRLYGVLEGECYWAILGMNTIVPLIDRRTRREVIGLETVET